MYGHVLHSAKCGNWMILEVIGCVMMNGSMKCFQNMSQI